MLEAKLEEDSSDHVSVFMAETSWPKSSRVQMSLHGDDFLIWSGFSSAVVSVEGVLAQIGLERFANAFAAAEIETEDLPFLTEEHLTGPSLRLPLGPALKLLRYLNDYSDDGRSMTMARPSHFSSSTSLRPRGKENVDWAFTPCVPPHCWHRCEKRIEGSEISTLFGDQNSASNRSSSRRSGSSSQEAPPEESLEEDDPRWKPKPRACPVPSVSTLSPFASGGGKPIGLVHPIGLAVPDDAVVRCVPLKSVDLAMGARVVDGPRVAKGTHQKGHFLPFKARNESFNEVTCHM